MYQIILVPFPQLTLSAEIFDKNTKIAQRKLAFKILKNLMFDSHITSLTHKMWEGHEFHLALYIEELTNSLNDKENELYTEVVSLIENNMTYFSLNSDVPWWIGDDKIHDSHKAYLLSINPQWYGKFWSFVKPTKKLIWPTFKEKNEKNNWINGYID